jgi:hypothetical protein
VEALSVGTVCGLPRPRGEPPRASRSRTSFACSTVRTSSEPGDWTLQSRTAERSAVLTRGPARDGRARTASCPCA